MPCLQARGKATLRHFHMQHIHTPQPCAARRFPKLVHPQTFWMVHKSPSCPRRGRMACWVMRWRVVPEGGEWRVGLCGGGFLRLCGMSVYPNNRITLKPYNHKCRSPSSRTTSFAHTCRKFRFAPHAVKQRWTSSTPCYALLPSKGFADEPQDMAFCRVKGCLLRAKRPSLTSQKAANGQTAGRQPLAQPRLQALQERMFSAAKAAASPFYSYLCMRFSTCGKWTRH